MGFTRGSQLLLKRREKLQKFIAHYIFDRAWERCLRTCTTVCRYSCILLSCNKLCVFSFTTFACVWSSVSQCGRYRRPVGAQGRRGISFKFSWGKRWIKIGGGWKIRKWKRYDTLKNIDTHVFWGSRSWLDNLYPPLKKTKCKLQPTQSAERRDLPDRV